MWIVVIGAAIVSGFFAVNADAEWVRFLLGGAVGGLAVLVFFLFGESRQQVTRLRSLENRLNRVEGADRDFGDEPESPSIGLSEQLARAAEDTSGEFDPVENSGKPPSSPVTTPLARDEQRGNVEPSRSPPDLGARASAVLELAFRWLRRWLTTGNVPVKVGVLISFFGVSFLLKYAADQNYLTLPIEVRLIGVGLAALAAMAFGWHQRQQRPIFSLSLQGGAVGVLFLTVYAAFHIYGVLPAIAAFGFLVVFAVAAGVLAVVQNAMALAVLGVVGGFLAPVLISTGSGNHVSLFSYYALLNGAVFGIAWFRAWRVLNLVGFVFTFFIGTVWGIEYYQAEYFASVEPFLVLFFVMYLGIGTAYGLRQSIKFRSYVDSSLVFGLPLVVFPLQKQLVEPFEYGTAISSAVLAVVYILTATVLLRSQLRHRVRLLGEAYIALGVGFATLAVPLAMTTHWTAVTWALEGAAMVWIGIRQGRKLPTAARVLLQAGDGVAMQRALLEAGWHRGDGLFLNEPVLGGVILSAAGLVSARWLERRANWFDGMAGMAAWALFGWGLAWWFGVLSFDIARVVQESWIPSAWLILLAVSVVVLILGQVYLAWHKVRVCLVAYLPLMLILAIAWLDRSDVSHYLADGGWLAWPLALLALGAVFRSEQGFLDRVRPWQRAMTVWLFGCLVLKELHWLVSDWLSAEIWAWAAVITASVGMHVLVSWLWRARAVGVDRHSMDWSVLGIGPVLALGGLLSVVLLVGSSGNAAPLVYLPLLNPLSLASLAAAMAALHWSRINALPGSEGDRIVWGALSGFAFLLVTSEVTRTAHHWANVPYRPDALVESLLVQAALSVVWALSALGAMVLGHHRRERTVYLCGAGLMAVVVGKLFLVDLAQSGTLERIVSFICVGLLLLAVGFLAPVPPRERNQEEPETTQ